MNSLPTPLAGLILLEQKTFADERGFFYESYQTKRYEALGIPPIVQCNVSRSKQNVIRGLHYQLPTAQGKLVSVIRGTVWDVVVDIRKNSPTYRQWAGFTLSDENHHQLYIPPGFAHGFCVLSEIADFYYGCTDFYTPGNEHGIRWNDPELSIDWPIANPILSEKDCLYPTLSEIADDCIFA